MNGTLPSNLTSTFIIPPASNSTAPFAGNATDQVSGQSALWALIALALNAMTLPSADDVTETILGFSAVRTSPFTCLADSLIAVLWFVYVLSKRRNVIQAARITRQHFRKNKDEHAARISSLAGLILFLLGPLPQAIKLVGMRGIPWTQTWGMCYLISFLLFIVVDALDLKHPAETHSTTDVELSRQHEAADSPELDPSHRIADTLHPYSWILHLLAHLTQFCVWMWISFVLLSLPYRTKSESEQDVFRAFGIIIGLKITLVAATGILLYHALRQFPRIFRLFGGGALTRLSKKPILFWGTWVAILVLFHPLQGGNPRFTIRHAKLDGVWYRQTLVDHTTVSLREYDACALMLSVYILCVLIVTSLDYVYHFVLTRLGRGRRTEVTGATEETEVTGSIELTEINGGVDQTEVTGGVEQTEVGAGGVEPTEEHEEQSMLSTRRLSYALALFNLTYGTLYYVLFFDGRGTKSASWTTMLG